jgi:hypothetical protein
VVVALVLPLAARAVVVAQQLEEEQLVPVSVQQGDLSAVAKD